MAKLRVETKNFKTQCRLCVSMMMGLCGEGLVVVVVAVAVVGAGTNNKGYDTGRLHWTEM